jgi:hypothetical protein
VEEAKRYDKGQIPWDGHPSPFKHASQWEGAYIDNKESQFDPQFFRILPKKIKYKINKIKNTKRNKRSWVEKLEKLVHFRPRFA